MKLILLLPFVVLGRDGSSYKLQLQHADRGYPLKRDHFLFVGNVDFTIKDYEVKCSSAELDSSGIANLYDVKIYSLGKVIVVSDQMKYSEDNGTAISNDPNNLKKTVFSFVDGSIK